MTDGNRREMKWQRGERRYGGSFDFAQDRLRPPLELRVKKEREMKIRGVQGEGTDR